MTDRKTYQEFLMESVGTGNCINTAIGAIGRLLSESSSQKAEPLPAPEWAIARGKLERLLKDVAASPHGLKRLDLWRSSGVALSVEQDFNGDIAVKKRWEDGFVVTLFFARPKAEASVFIKGGWLNCLDEAIAR